MPDQLLNVPEMPEGLEYLWEWYLDLQGVSKLSYMEIESWARMTGKHIRFWEAEMLMSLFRLAWEFRDGV